MIHFPDASIETFWFAHDLAAVIGVDTNSEAAERLERAVAGAARGIEIDYEADAVSVHADDCEAMLGVLSSLEAIAQNRPLWRASDVDAARSHMRAWLRPTPVSYDAGAVVALPLCDGSFGAIGVCAFDAGGSPIVVLLDARAPSREALEGAVDWATPVACVCILDSEIVSGEWPVVATRGFRDLDSDALAARVRGSSSSGGTAVDFLEAYFGLRTWDAYGDPRYFDLMLLDGVNPGARCYKRDVFERRLVAAFGRIPTCVSEGPASIHVTLAYPGSGLPRLIDLPKPRQLAEKMLRSVPGATAVETGGGAGVFDLFVTTTDAAAACKAIEGAAAELRLNRDLILEAFPPISIDDLWIVVA